MVIQLPNLSQATRAKVKVPVAPSQPPTAKDRTASLHLARELLDQNGMYQTYQLCDTDVYADVTQVLKRFRMKKSLKPLFTLPSCSQHLRVCNWTS